MNDDAYHSDIDQLTRIMSLVGKPDEKLLQKLGSEEVYDPSNLPPFPIPKF